MSTPDQPATATTPPESPAWPGTEEDARAALQSAYWFHSNYSDELTGPYQGMHVAILGERIIDADRDLDTLVRRLETKSDVIPLARVICRYVPADADVNAALQ